MPNIYFVVSILPITICLVFVLFFDLFNLLKGHAPFVPSSRKQIKSMLKLAKIEKGIKIAELGSGDARIVTALAKEGAQVTGYEINPVLWLLGNLRILLSGTRKHAKVKKTNFMDVDLSQFDILVIYGIAKLMPKLEEKLLKEGVGSEIKVISNTFEFPNKEAVRTIEKAHLYRF
jgi:hypothetical protein